MAPKDTTLCGTRCWYPPWLQRFATAKSFLVVYGLLGFTQAMSFMYFIVSLTTLEKRFKIPSHTTGIVLSGNEISQIMLSLFLSYWGGQRNRPRWIAWGVVICGLSCFILAMPHFIYGAGEDALRLTKEYVDSEKEWSILHNTTSTVSTSSYHKLCSLNRPVDAEEDCDEMFSYVPLVLIFLSQFILGIGNTLWYLGHSYLDDNTKKVNTPMMLGWALSLRMVGPMLGFVLSYICLNIYIDPWKTPLITSNDPRWLGAWWTGWIVLGFSMIFFAVLVGLFPRDLPKKKKDMVDNTSAKDEQYDATTEEMVELNLNENHEKQIDVELQPLRAKKPTMKDFPTALKRLLLNKLLICNIFSGIFYILGSGGFMTFISKYMEVQFNKTKADSTIVAGPLNILGIVVGLMASGWFITKRKPGTSKVLFWNVILGCTYMVGQFSYMFLSCSDDKMPMPVNGALQLNTNCNQNCDCDGLPYNPVCDQSTGQTFFSACHAGCSSWNAREQIYTNCSCSRVDPLLNLLTLDTLDESTFTNDVFSSENDTILPREIRSENNFMAKVQSVMNPGACLAGCQRAFIIFTALSTILNLLGSSGRVGNILVNYRVVSVEDKAFSQGLMLMLISLFALIPGPILYGWIIDSTCLVWTYKCGRLGNCQIYDRRKFRLRMNSAGLALTTIGVVFDFFVWYYGRGIDLYSEDYEEKNQKYSKSHKVVKGTER